MGSGMYHSNQVGAGTANLFRGRPVPPRSTIVVLGQSNIPTRAVVRSLPVTLGGFSMVYSGSVFFVFTCGGYAGMEVWGVIGGIFKLFLSLGRGGKIGERWSGPERVLFTCCRLPLRHLGGAGAAVWAP